MLTDGEWDELIAVMRERRITALDANGNRARVGRFFKQEMTTSSFTYPGVREASPTDPLLLRHATRVLLRADQLCGCDADAVHGR